ncbi:MAG: hypothetical protein HZB41_12095 [Ignavibacteriae bacterium]|nr:hypothetical protein [Ignavibacteriota bacterium]
MKNINKFFVMIILLLFSFFSISAQNTEFKILASRGQVLIQKNGKGTWEKIFTGGLINLKDKIKMLPGSYLGLVHAKGKTLELKKDGIYTVSQLSKEIAGMKSTMSGQFANLIISEVGNASGNIIDKDSKKSLGQSGAVERNIDSNVMTSNGNQKQEDRILIKSPVKEHSINQDILFEWTRLKNENEYEFYLTDRYDRLEFSKTTSDTFLLVDTKKLKLEKGSYYFWRITVKGKPELKSDEACFLILTDTEISGINDTLKLLKEELGEEHTATSSLMYAVYFEKCNLINEAKVSYLEALKIAPDVEVYNNLYYNFLKRHFQTGY